MHVLAACIVVCDNVFFNTTILHILALADSHWNITANRHFSAFPLSTFLGHKTNIKFLLKIKTIMISHTHCKPTELSVHSASLIWSGTRMDMCALPFGNTEELPWKGFDIGQDLEWLETGRKSLVVQYLLLLLVSTPPQSRCREKVVTASGWLNACY